MSDKKAFIFIGRSGCGKGTQVKHLTKYLKERDPEREIFHLESGQKFRELVMGDSYTSKLAKKVNDAGGLQPQFLAVHVWTHLLIEKLQGDEHLIIDGTPRQPDEARILDGAMKFYGYAKPNVIWLDVSESWARERLRERGREDDRDASDIDNKMRWYEERVYPTILYFQGDSLYDFHKINGEQTIDQVHSDIVKNLSLS